MLNPRRIIRSIVRYAFIPTFFIIIGCTSEDQVEPLKPLKPLHVATGNWEPYIGQNLPNNGPLAEMLSTILADMHYVPEFKFYSWPMVETHLRAGYPFIALPFIKTKERVEKWKFKFSEPIGEFDYVLFYHKKRLEEAKTIGSLEDLKNIQGTIGYIRGYAKLPKTKIDDDKYKEVASTIDGFNQLRDGNEIHYLLEGKKVGLSLLESRHLVDDKDDFMYLGQPEVPHASESSELISRVELRIMLSPQLNPNFLKEIDRAIQKHKKSDYFQSLERRMHTRVKAPETGFLVAEANESIYGYPNQSDKKTRFTIPRDSKVLIIKWGRTYREKITDTNRSPETDLGKVKILNGPFKGKVMWVDNQHITLGR